MSQSLTFNIPDLSSMAWSWFVSWTCFLVSVSFAPKLFILPWIHSSDPRLHILLAHVLSHFGHVRLCDPMDCSLPGSSVHGTLQARILEWVAMSSSRRSFWFRDQTCVYCTAGRFFTIESLRKPIIFLGILESGNLVVAAASWEAHDFLMLKLDHWWTDAHSRDWPRGTVEFALPLMILIN